MYDQRIQKLQTYLSEENFDALLVSNFYNILYLTGFKTLTEDEREAFLLITGGDCYLFTDGRYFNNSELRIKNSELIIRLIEPGRGLVDHLKNIVEQQAIKKLAIESEDLRYGEYQKLRINLDQTQLIPTGKIIIKIREIKDNQEIKLIKKACKVSDQCLAKIIGMVGIGTSEKEIAWRLEAAVKEKGYDIAFDPIVAIDTNSAVPHYNTQTGSGIVKNRSVILIDFGVKYRDYNCDITRMVFVNPEDTTINLYDRLLKIQTATINIVNKIKNPVAIDKFCREKTKEHDLPDYSHATGHGVGLEMHEYPKISQFSQDKIVDGQIFTIEPGICFSGKFGLRIEDTILTDKGQARVLTHLNKFPIIVNL